MTRIYDNSKSPILNNPYEEPRLYYDTDMDGNLDYSHVVNSHKARFELNDYYHKRDLIPRHFEPLLGGLNAAITIINYQQLEPKVLSGKHASPLDGKLQYVDGELKKQTGKEDYTVMLTRILHKGAKGKRMLIINDEAHHCYLPKKLNQKGKKDEETAEGEAENQNAMVWYEGLRQMKLCGYKIQHVYDLSDAKRHCTLDYWLPAANNLAQHGRWDFVEVSDIDNIKRILIHKIQEL